MKCKRWRTSTINKTKIEEQRCIGDNTTPKRVVYANERKVLCSNGEEGERVKGAPQSGGGVWAVLVQNVNGANVIDQLKLKKKNIRKSLSFCCTIFFCKLVLQHYQFIRMREKKKIPPDSLKRN